jgi:ribosomal protein L24
MTAKTTTTKTYKIRLKKGDTVVVRSGKYKGKTGKITATHGNKTRVFKKTGKEIK